jgi:hypothetical protein
MYLLLLSRIHQFIGILVEKEIMLLQGVRELSVQVIYYVEVVQRLINFQYANFTVFSWEA